MARRDVSDKCFRQPPDFASRTKGISARVSFVVIHFFHCDFSSSRMWVAELNRIARSILSELGSIFNIVDTFFSSVAGSVRRSSYRTKQKPLLPFRIRTQLITCSSQVPTRLA